MLHARCTGPSLYNAQCLPSVYEQIKKTEAEAGDARSLVVRFIAA